LSFTALIAACLGKAVDEDKSVQAYSQGCHTEICVTMYNEKGLNAVQPWTLFCSVPLHQIRYGIGSHPPSQVAQNRSQSIP
jgi:hypothetical protein